MTPVWARAIYEFVVVVEECKQSVLVSLSVCLAASAPHSPTPLYLPAPLFEGLADDLNKTFMGIAKLL